jgi:hypothetical protein
LVILEDGRAEPDSSGDRVRFDCDCLHACGTESNVTTTGGSVCNADTGSTEGSASYADTGDCTYFGKTDRNFDTASGSINALGTDHANGVPTPQEIDGKTIHKRRLTHS